MKSIVGIGPDSAKLKICLEPSWRKEHPLNGFSLLHHSRKTTQWVLFPARGLKTNFEFDRIGANSYNWLHNSWIKTLKLLFLHTRVSSSYYHSMTMTCKYMWFSVLYEYQHENILQPDPIETLYTWFPGFRIIGWWLWSTLYFVLWFVHQEDYSRHVGNESKSISCAFLAITND